MNETLEKAKEELKRVDHLVFVSLKYTRTVDVLINVVKRMVAAYDYLVEALLRYDIHKGNLEILEETPIEKGQDILDLYKDELVQRNVRLYFIMRKILRSTYDKENEYRRHVGLRCIINNRETLININVVTEYFQDIKEFYEFVKEKIDNDAE